MERVLWLIIMIPIGILFTCLGICAWRRKKPMWFWSGKEVKESEISDIPAYNRANGIMWLCFSAIFWLAAVLGALNSEAAGIVVAVGTIVGIPVLFLTYKRIYSKYKR
ncbi:hypothetical protein [Ruminococcus flavefaciens]|uniref:SdpI/YhfL protein family protein n=1 Tax=Ruminococcus flavefaciens TaxID=1265 RepID=A0A1K1NX88_RUMFL|nr:hypothetical protein [Ruminococcus flavefaciens]SFW39919.1 hypothetical protein SAMN02910280_2301 [Ruminococcus flavefaciens]